MPISDEQETRLLREARFRERRTAKDLNNPGKRLEWVREVLGLQQKEVCEATGIPRSSYCGREAGVRTDFIEEYLLLAQFYDKEWQSKFSGNYPHFNGEEVRKVTPIWIMFGTDDLQKDTEALISEFRARQRELEHEVWAREAELLRQLSLFTEK